MAEFTAATLNSVGDKDRFHLGKTDYRGSEMSEATFRVEDVPGSLLLVRCPSLWEVSDYLCQELATASADVFTPELICISDQAAQRWLSQQLGLRLGASDHGKDGISAGIDWVSFVELHKRILGVDQKEIRTADPWQPAELVWTVLNQLDQVHQEEWATPLTTYLRKPDDPRLPGRRIATAHKIARLFSQYASYRFDLVQQWRTDVTDDGWQPRLWRRICAEIGDPLTRLEQKCQEISSQPRRLPKRFFLIDPPGLSSAEKLLIKAVSLQHHITMMSVDPRSNLDGLSIGSLGSTTENMLVDRLAQDLTSKISSLCEISDEVQTITTQSERPHDVLGLLKASIRAEKHHSFPHQFTNDNSVRFHCSHDPDRQSEVLRDALLTILEDDHDIEPRDILVVCADLNSYSPFISAVFDSDHEQSLSSAQQIRVKISHASIKQTNPLVAVLDTIVGFDLWRAESSAVLDLLRLPPVSLRFRLDEEDHDRIMQLISTAGVRWGLDIAAREHFGLGGFGHNTWQAGLDRIALGVAMTEDELSPIGTVLPLDDVEAGDIDLFAAIAECIELLQTCVDFFTQVHPLSDWIDFCREIIDNFTVCSPADRWQHHQLISALASLLAGTSDQPRLVSYGDFCVLFQDLIEQRVSNYVWGSGSLVVCDSNQAVHVPYKVIILLGFDEQTFSRHNNLDGDDLMQADPRPGDPNPRHRSRQRLYDAINSAEKQLLFIYPGRDPQTNQDLPLAAPIEEIREMIDRFFPQLEPKLSDQLTVQHSLQPCAAINFSANAPIASFDIQALQGAQALLAWQQLPSDQRLGEPSPRFGFTQISPPTLDQTLTIDTLAKFLQHPVQGLLRQAGLYYTEDPTVDSDEIPIDLDGLQRWKIGSRMLQLALAGKNLDQIIRAEWLRGSVPPKAGGEKILSQLRTDVTEIMDVWMKNPVQRTRQIPVQLQLPTQTILLGNIPVSDQEVVEVSYSRPGAKHLLSGWVKILALTASTQQPWRWRMIGKRQQVVLGPVPKNWALPALANLVELYHRGLAEPLPLPAAAAQWYATRMLMGSDESDPKFRKDLAKELAVSLDQQWKLFYPASEAILEIPPTEHDALNHRDNTCFGRLARRVWEPLLRCQEQQ